jgi:hypothetical protein
VHGGLELLIRHDRQAERRYKRKLGGQYQGCQMTDTSIFRDFLQDIFTYEVQQNVSFLITVDIWQRWSVLGDSDEFLIVGHERN